MTEGKRLTPESISEMRRNMTDSAFALLLDHRARVIEEDEKLNFAEIGIICVAVDESEAWRHITKTDGEICHSFDDWLLDALPVSRSAAYSARKVAQRLSSIPVEERSLISQGNLKTLAEVDDPKVTLSRPILDAAKEMSPREFRDKIMREHPEQHLLAKSPMNFKPDTDQRTDIESAMDMARKLDDAHTREEQLQAIAVFYVEHHEEPNAPRKPETRKHNPLNSRREKAECH